MIGMQDKKPSSRSTVTVMRLTATVAEQRIHVLALDSDNVQFSDHALEQMGKRGIFDIDVFRVLRNGHVDEAPTKTKYEEWKCKIIMQIRGSRQAGVVTVFLHNGKLFIKTVEWEDLK